jgi:molybdopterin-guanine dinucleotide biosynthesis protein A
MNPGRIFLLTGEVGSGKTTLCQELARKAQERGIDLAGLISPAVFKGTDKAAINALDLRTWKTCQLAVLAGSENSVVRTRKWSFSTEGIEWGNQILSRALPCDLFILDELGPLELELGKGWVKGLDAIDSGAYQTALVVVRPTLLDEVKKRWDVTGVIEVGKVGSKSSAAVSLLDCFDIS